MASASSTFQRFSPAIPSRWACAGVVSVVALMALPACQQQEISRTEKGYSVPTFTNTSPAGGPTKASGSQNK